MKTLILLSIESKILLIPLLWHLINKGYADAAYFEKNRNIELKNRCKVINLKDVGANSNYVISNNYLRNHLSIHYCDKLQAGNGRYLKYDLSTNLYQQHLPRLVIRYLQSRLRNIWSSQKSIRSETDQEMKALLITPVIDIDNPPSNLY